MKAYKGLKRNADGTLQCHDFKYEVGKTYKYDGDISICKSGFHACHELHQVWLFYPNDGNNVFYEVECGGEIEESNDGDGKFVCSEITLLKEVNISNVAKFDDSLCFSKGFARVKLNNKWNFINTKGELVSPNRWFDKCDYFSNGFGRVMLNGKENFITVKGEILFPDQWFDWCGSFVNGCAVVNLDYKYNFINTKGELLWHNQWFDNCLDFCNGFGLVMLDGKTNYINTEGKLLSDVWFYLIDDFVDGFAKVLLDGKYYYINAKGEIKKQKSKTN